LLDESKIEADSNQPRREPSDSVALPEPESQPQTQSKHTPIWPNVMRLPKAIGNWFRRSIWERLKTALAFADKHDGAITALATVAIVVLTYFYVSYSKQQWKEMQNARRPWLGMSDRLTIKGSPSMAYSDISPILGQQARMISVKFDVSGTIKNFGASPARRELRDVRDHLLWLDP
jgi:hypothetical protein